ncbi:hypothetical protein AAE478_008102 [Parahypoxylon ruwenzoriense]
METSSDALYHASVRNLSRHSHISNMTLSLTLALKDSASGTIPLSHRQATLSLLQADLPRIVTVVPRILSAVSASTIGRRRVANWAELREVALYLLVSLLELQLLLSVALLWLIFPGLVLLPCLSFQAASIWILLRCMNNRHPSPTFTAGKPADDPLGSEEQRLYWIVVDGIATNNEQFCKEILPKLARVFGYDMHAFLSYRLGFLLDIILIFLQRNLPVTTARSVALYDSVRASLLNPDISGVRILAHGTGALDVSWLLARLSADLPPGDRFGKLQVFTFGAASVEMTLPLGSVNAPNENGIGQCYPIVTHFAFFDDPFAQIGVLSGIRQRLEGRFIGRLYTIRNTTPALKKSCFLPRSYRHTLNEYLDVLLPDGDPRAGILSQVCKIDRELTEMRELAALVQSVTNERPTTRRDSKRPSWTALGAIATGVSSGYKNRDDVAGLISLEEVRRQCKSLEGSRGYYNNPLADAVRSGCQVHSRSHMVGIKTTMAPQNTRTSSRKCGSRRKGSRCMEICAIRRGQDD